MLALTFYNIYQFFILSVLFFLSLFYLLAVFSFFHNDLSLSLLPSITFFLFLFYTSLSFLFSFLGQDQMKQSYLPSYSFLWLTAYSSGLLSWGLVLYMHCRSLSFYFVWINYKRTLRNPQWYLPKQIRNCLLFDWIQFFGANLKTFVLEDSFWIWLCKY